jgi:hypothetical protein
VRVRVVGVGVCHTDLAGVAGAFPLSLPGRVGKAADLGMKSPSTMLNVISRDYKGLCVKAVLLT